MILIIVGPTAVGKSDAAVEIARQVPSEIVAVDSMQVYRGMEIGTSKPPASLRKEIPHHGLDLADPEEEFDVARYVQAVRPRLQEIEARGRMPILVAGSGLYLRALLDGLCDAPGKSAAVRQELLEEAQEKGTQVLHARLLGVDPESAARIHPNDLRKIVRALEVYQVSGQPLSQWHRETHPFVESPETLKFIGLTCERTLLYRRIEERIDGWLGNGWLEEARDLHRRSLSMTARKALGYQELFRYLEGELDWESCVHLMKRNSRRYAKRQLTWFGADTRIEWMDLHGTSPRRIDFLQRLPLPRSLAC